MKTLGVSSSVRRRLARVAPLAVACGALTAAGCSSSGSGTRIDITVMIDPALALDSVALAVQGNANQTTSQNFAVKASGTPPVVTPVVWEVVVPNPSAPFDAVVTATGLKTGSSDAVVTQVADALVITGHHTEVMLTLSAPCTGVTCSTGQTCMGGSCRPVSVFGGSTDGGTDGSAGRGGSGGHGGTGVAGQGGAGGHGGQSGAGVAGQSGGGHGGQTEMDAGTDSGPTTSGIGHACAMDSDCTSKHCAQGVCCMTACTASCYACTNALTGSSPDGTCAVVSSGLNDPANACTAATATSCGNTGHCDGKGACEKFGGSTICQAASCGTAGFTAASTCDGNGNCTAGTTTNCKGFTCSATTGCATSCASDTDCPGGYCTSAKTCAATLSDGSACTANDQCTHANCVSGICCSTACSGTCMTCATGACKPVGAGGSSNGVCPVDSAACGRDGTCDGNGGCRYAPSTISCGSPACSGGRLTPAGTCNGAGTCSIPSASGCPGGVACASTTACKSPTCAADSDCQSGYCASGTCTAKKGNGSTCSASDQCSNGNCISGVCCATTCGTCMTCATGTCLPVAAGGSSNGACSVDSPPCGHDGTCDGSGGCRYAVSTVSCRTASCSGSPGTETFAATCNGAGSCPPAVTQSCNEFACGTSSCLTSCTSSAQCISGATCVSGVCTACGAGQTICSGSCINVNGNDGSNCGACGHSCLGGVCNSGKCAPITMATVPSGAFSREAVLALSNSNVYVAVPTGMNPWSLYVVPKTAVNSTPSPIFTLSGSGTSHVGYLGATDSLVIGQGTESDQGGSASQLFSCTPSNCASTAQSWFSTSGSVAPTVCDPTAQECFAAISSLTPTIEHATLGTASQTTPTDYNPILLQSMNTALAAVGGFLYLGVDPSGQGSPSTLARMTENGASGTATLDGFGVGAIQNITSTQIYMAAGGGLVSIPIPGGVGASPAVLPGTSNWQISAWGDDKAIYFGTAALRWVTCPASGCAGTPTDIGDASLAIGEVFNASVNNLGLVSPNLIGDTQAIYWIDASQQNVNNTSFNVMKLAR